MSIIQKVKSGLHAFWNVNEQITVGEFRKLKELIEEIDGDTATKDDVDNLNTRVRDLEDITADVPDNSRDLDKFGDRIDQLESDVEDLGGRVAELEKDYIGDLENRIEKLEENDPDEFENRTQDVEDNVKDHENRIDQLEEAVLNVKFENLVTLLMNKNIINLTDQEILSIGGRVKEIRG